MLKTIEKLEQDSINELWFLDDLKYNLCIHLSCLSSSKNESFGSIAVQKIGDSERIIGVGWNMYLGGITNMPRQGYCNHSEYQSLILAQVLGYDVSNSDIPIEIYSAGRLIKSNLLFLHHPKQPFSCTKCTTSIEKINKNIRIVTPSEGCGWLSTPLFQAHDSAKEFKKNGVKRDMSMNSCVPISTLNISKMQEKMDELVRNIEDSAIVIDEVVKDMIFNQYESLLTLSTQERRAYIENIFGSLL
ncbi:MAG: hypothetical protein ACOX0R_03670 [Candidatus Dojkabacteria bacterium]|jgi:hypothetical protein